VHNPGNNNEQLVKVKLPSAPESSASHSAEPAQTKKPASYVQRVRECHPAVKACLAIVRHPPRMPMVAETKHVARRVGWQLSIQILALTLLHIHTLPGGPLPLLCSRAHAGVVLPHPHRTLPHSDTHSSFVFSKRKLQKLCVGRPGPVSL